MLYFTICSNNYLAQAITLGNSLILHNPGFDFIIGFVDRKKSSINYSVIPYKILQVENIGIPDFKNFYRKYDITELNIAVKPIYFQYYFADNKNSKTVVYLYPDILVFSPFIDLEEELGSADIVITQDLTAL